MTKIPSFKICDNTKNLLYTSKERGVPGKTVWLKLASEKKKRRIGRIFPGSVVDALVFEKTIKEEHIMTVNRSVGFCDEMLRQLPLDKTVLFVFLECIEPAQCGGYRIRTKHFYLSLKDARDVGSYLHMKKQGFERQFFVPLANFKLNEGCHA